MNIADIAAIVNAENSGGSGFEPDLVIKMNTVSVTSGTTAEVVSGLAWNELVDKIKQGEHVLVVVYGIIEGNYGMQKTYFPTVYIGSFDGTTIVLSNTDGQLIYDENGVYAI